MLVYLFVHFVFRLYSFLLTQPFFRYDPKSTGMCYLVWMVVNSFSSSPPNDWDDLDMNVDVKLEIEYHPVDCM